MARRIKLYSFSSIEAQSHYFDVVYECRIPHWFHVPTKDSL